MTRVLVLYYSSYGHIKDMANAVATGARSLEGVHVDVKKVPETVPQHIREQSGYVDDPDTPVAEIQDLAEYDAIVFGTPTRFGGMAAQMKQFIDQAGGLWASNALVGKVGAVFTSTGSQHGGHEAVVLSSHIPLLHFGMVIVGLPYTFADQMRSDQIVGIAIWRRYDRRGDGSLQPTETDLAGARHQGCHVATIAAKLATASNADRAREVA